MDTLKVGMRESLEWEVTEKFCTTRGEFKVFSTPSMTLLVEAASHKLVQPHLKPGQGQVGTAVNIRHLAATPLGKTVRAEVEVTAIDRRKLTLHAKVYDEAEQIGEAEHERFIIDVAKYTERLRKKILG